MSVSAGDIFRVAVKYSLPDLVTAYNVLGLYCTAGSCTDAELLTAVDSWLTTAYAYLQSSLSDAIDIDEARVSKMLWVATEWVVQEIIGTVYPTFTSTDTQDMLPHAVAAVVTMPTIVPRRKGKIFVPGMTDSDADASTLASGMVTALGNFASGIQTVLLPGTANLWYYILCNDGTVRNAISATVGSLSGTQRRRKPGVGV